MGDKVLKIGTVHQCNCCLGSKTLHPLVSVIDLSKADLSPHTDIKFGFYTILLSECKCEAYAYGHQCCDFSDGTLVCLTPGESISMKEKGIPCLQNISRKATLRSVLPALGNIHPIDVRTAR
jgi:hypothetical protein